MSALNDNDSPATDSCTSPKPRRIHWLRLVRNVAPHFGLLAAPFTFTWSGFWVFAVLYAVTGLGITLGFHRLHTHRSYSTWKWFDYLLATVGTFANQGGLIEWVANHRAHHRFSDQEGDPHSPNHGFLWSHFGWLLLRNPSTESWDAKRHYANDLCRDPVYVALERYADVSFPLQLASLYFLGNHFDGGGLSWLIWGGCVRFVALCHTTSMVNSLTHRFGSHQHDTRDRSTNLWWLGVLTFGEGYHNSHHAFPTSARHGLKWYELDVTYYVIVAMSLIGIVWDVKLPDRRSSESQEC